MRNLFKQKNTHNQTSEVQCLKTHTQIVPSQATFTMTGHISKTLSIPNLILEDLCHKMLIQIVLSQVMYTMIGLISKTQSTHNQTLEDQCHKMLTQTALFQAMSITTGLISKTLNIHNQTLEDLCRKTLIQTALFQATSITIGLTHNKTIQTHQIPIQKIAKKMYNLKELNWFQFGNMITKELYQKDSHLKEMIDWWTL
jgi:hypothetical protein